MKPPRWPCVIIAGQVVFRERTDEWTVYKPKPDWRAAAVWMAHQDTADTGVVIGPPAGGDTLTDYGQRLKHPFHMLNATPAKPLEIGIHDTPVFLIRNQYWLGKADAVQTRIESDPDLVRSSEHHDKGLTILVYRHVRSAAAGGHRH